MEIGCTDTLPDNVPVSATRGQAHPLLHHDVLELSPYLPDLEQDTEQRRSEPSPLAPYHPSPQHPAHLGYCPYLPHGLGMDKMIVTPDGGVIIILPLQVDIQVGQMITLGDSKLLPDLIALLLSALERKKDRYSEHRQSRPSEKTLHLPAHTTSNTLICDPDNTENNVAYNKIFTLKHEG